MSSNSRRSYVEKSLVVRLNAKILSKIFTIGKLLNSKYCIDVAQSNENIKDLLNKCLDDIKGFVEKEISLKRSTSTLTGFGKCFKDCLKIVHKYSKMFKQIDSLYIFFIKNLTSVGDSKFSEKDIPDEVKRLLRHAEIDNETFSIHFIRIGLAKSFIRDLMNCIISMCKKDDYSKVIEFIKERINKINDEYARELLINEFSKWCKNYNICS